MKKIGVYLHIPFCQKKCCYCDFISYSNQEKMIADYVEVVKKEIQYKQLQNYNIQTVYLGGGTPSYIGSKHVQDLLNHIPNKKDAEITIEVNPGTVQEQKLKDYKKVGVNRLSIGLQVTQGFLLQEIGRIHTYEQFLTTYELARKIGYENINVDLMLGLPNQMVSDVQESIEKIVDLNPEHISVYSLIVEPDTILGQEINKGKLYLPTEQQEREQYWLVKKVLEQAGYYHYEISNFSKPKYISKHNFACWEQKEYIGIGLAAHSFQNNIRYSNITQLEKYIELGKQGKFEKMKIIQEELNITSLRQEYMLLGLRKIEGVKIGKFKEKFGVEPKEVFQKELEKLQRQGLIKQNLETICLTNKGLDLANLVWEEFVS